MNKLIIGVAALAVTLTACGDYGAGASPPKAAGTHDRTATTPPPTTQPERVRTVVEYRDRPVEVEVTPTACLDALVIAEDIYDVSAEFAGVAADAITAASERDTIGLRVATGRFEDFTAQVKALTSDWQTARDDCRAAAD